MHKELVGLIPNGHKTLFCNLFGYSSKSLPGIEIVGLGSKGKAIKEKIIYLNKKFKIKAPANRYVMCVEESYVASLKDDDYRWLELPFLLMYWSMAKVIPIANLSNCLCGGKVSSRGRIESTPTSLHSLDELNDYLDRDYWLITSSQGCREGESVIPLEEIIKFPMFDRDAA